MLSLDERAALYLSKAAFVDSENIPFVSVDKLSIHEIVLSGLTAAELVKDTNAVTDTLTKVGKDLDNYKALDLSIINVHDKFAVDSFVLQYLQKYAEIFRSSATLRFTWLDCRLVNINLEDRKKVALHLAKVEIAREKYLAELRKIESHKSSTTQAKVFFGVFNEQRRAVNKELAQAELITIKGLKTGPFCLVDDPDCKNLLKSLKDYNKAKENYNTQDNYLKKKIGEMINK